MLIDMVFFVGCFFFSISTSWEALACVRAPSCSSPTIRTARSTAWPKAQQAPLHDSAQCVFFLFAEREVGGGGGGGCEALSAFEMRIGCLATTSPLSVLASAPSQVDCAFVGCVQAHHLFRKHAAYV
jgi:hypothetical protein